MFDPVGHWNRYLAAGSLMRSTGQGAAETLDGANQVIAARAAIMGKAMVTPWTANYGELARMLPEKVEAFTRAGSAVAAVWEHNHSLWRRHMEHLGMMTMRGRAPTFAEVADLGERTALLMLRSVETTAKLGSAGLAPLRTQVRRNVRRLGAGGKASRAGRMKVSH